MCVRACVTEMLGFSVCVLNTWVLSLCVCTSVCKRNKCLGGAYVCVCTKCLGSLYVCVCQPPGLCVCVHAHMTEMPGLCVCSSHTPEFCVSECVQAHVCVHQMPGFCVCVLASHLGSVCLGVCVCPRHLGPVCACPCWPRLVLARPQ